MTVNRTANEAVTIELSFWPALSRPEGVLRRLNQARSSRSQTSSSWTAARRLRRSPDGDDEQEGGDPGERGVDVDRLQQRPASDRFGEARQVEAEAAAKQHDKRGSVDPVHSALGAAEAQQPCAG